jgi:hypothetical protein
LRVDPSHLKQVIFNGKPKRAFKANASSNIAYSDPKRIHIALKEFNDMSANEVFKGIISSIQDNKQADQKLASGLERRGTLAPSAARQAQQARDEVGLANVNQERRGSVAATNFGRSMTMGISLGNEKEEEA